MKDPLIGLLKTRGDLLVCLLGFNVGCEELWLGLLSSNCLLSPVFVNCLLKVRRMMGCQAWAWRESFWSVCSHSSTLNVLSEVFWAVPAKRFLLPSSWYVALILHLEQHGIAETSLWPVFRTLSPPSLYIFPTVSVQGQEGKGCQELAVFLCSESKSSLSPTSSLVLIHLFMKASASV